MQRTLATICVLFCALTQPLHANDDNGSFAEPVSSFDLPGSAINWIFNNENDTVYIFLEDSQIISVDISNLDAPVVLDTVTLPDFASWHFARIVENTLYIFQSNLFFIIDIQDPTSMNYLDNRKAPSGNIISATAHDNYLYLGAQEESMAIYNITDPSIPEFVSLSPNTNSLLAVINDIGYSTKGEPLDLTNPLDPTPIGSVPQLTSQYSNFHLDQSVLHLFGSNNASIDISDPLDPDLLSLYPNFYASNYGTYPNNGSIFFSHPVGEHTIRITDLSLPSAPYALEDEIGLPGINQLNTIHTIDGQLLALTPDSIQVFNLHTTPLVGSHHTSGPANDIMIIEKSENQIAILANDGGALQFFNINAPNNPILLNTFQLPDNAFAIDRKDDVLYVATERDKLNLVDISDITNPTIITNIDTGRRTRDVLVREELLYVIDRVFGLLIYDISTPDAPQILSTTDTPGWATDITINDSGTTAYIAHSATSSSPKIQIIDITNSLSPTIIGSIDDFDDLDKLTIDGNYLYATDGNDGYRIIDISDTSNPEYILHMNDFDVLKESSDSGFAHEIQLHGDYLYFANGTGGFVSIYNANPLHPVPNQWIQSQFSNQGLASTRRFIVRDGLAFTAVLDGGLRIYDIADLAICPIDLNRDYNLDSLDISYFLGAFAEFESIADLNGDLNHDFYDVSIFFNFFTQACP
tara:strand:- start:6913 stop:9000 length:2088 start_codon:yes stop_codon:yes gene_type:complete